MTKPLQWLLLHAAGGTIRNITRAVFEDDAYFRCNPEIAGSGFLPAADYFLFGANERRDPHSLFSTGYYFDLNPDVRDSGENPLLHYVRFGAREGRDPHWLFNTNYYRSQYPDISPSLNPFLHYLKAGRHEHRQTSPFFDPEFSRSTQVEASRSKRGVLIRYLEQGSRDDWPPSADFDPKYYMGVHRDIDRKLVEPVEHYIRFGKAEGRRTREPRFESGEPDNYLPVASISQEDAGKPTERTVDIVIPVYRGLSETRVCLESVLAATNRMPIRLIVINDWTPEPDLAAYLRDLSAKKLIHLVEHKSNLGFVASVNEGMSLDPESDIILLNSDTEVFGNWVDRLAAHAYSGRVASVTPFSNNATICSYPKFCQSNAVPKGVSAAEIDSVMYAANAGRHCAIPTAVGFCMYIRRDALNQLGLFDQATFGRGYGEENDFCMRALYAGWSHLLAADTYVYHAGSVSFGQASDAQQQAMKALLGKHPRYLDHVGWHVRINPANAFRIAATLYRLRHADQPTRLNILHNLGGGTLEHVRKVAHTTRNEIAWLNLEPATDGGVRLYCERPDAEFSLILDPVYEQSLLLSILRYIKLERIHIHHLLHFTFNIKRWIRNWDVPYDITLHDYYFLCPRINLKDENGKYCGEGSCACQELSPNEDGYLDLFSWRTSHGDLLSGADRIIAPSADTAARFQRYFPELTIIPAWHELCEREAIALPVAENQPLKVAVLGVMARLKGFANLRECVTLAANTAAPVEFVLVGGFDNETEPLSDGISSTGAYQSEELPALLERHAPHLVWFPSQLPETFSYTLSACLSNRLPVAVPDLGALSERLDGRKWSWVLPWETTPQEWLAFFVKVRQEYFARQVSPAAPNSARPVERDFYPAQFLQAQSGITIGPATQEGKPSVLVLASSFDNGQVQACGYIRLIQPLTHPAIGKDFRISLASVETALYRHADAIIVQRTSVTSLDRAKRLLDHCRRLGTRLVYEIDDDLFRLPEDHPEHAEYSEGIKAAKLIARAADAVTVSTEVLQQLLLRYNENVVLIPNYLDERLWFEERAPQVPAFKTIRALYMGTRSHTADLAMLEEPVRFVKDKFNFELDVIGVVKDSSSSSWFQSKPAPERIAVSYPNFVRWLALGGPWDFGLAPLQESRFNAHKSGIKAHEYAGLGLFTVASAVVPYLKTIEDGKTGMLVPNTTADWYESLGLLCESSRLRQRLSREVHSCRHAWTLASNAERIRASWKQALFGTGFTAGLSAPGLKSASQGT